MTTKPSPTSQIANEELKRINRELKEKIKQLTTQVTQLKDELVVKNDAINSMAKDLETAIKAAQMEPALHQNIKPKPKPKPTKQEEKKEEIINKKRVIKPKDKPTNKSRGMIGIIGAGIIGAQLATLLSLKKYIIIMIDRQKPLLEKAEKINKSICESYLQQNLIKKSDIIASKIIYCESMNDINKYSNKIEIIIDTSHDVYKQQVLQQIIKIINSNCMIITNSIKKSITELSSYIINISRDMCKNLIGINLLYFELSMQNNECIEIIPSWMTNSNIVSKCKSLIMNDLGRQCVILHDCCGFISNRLNAVWINEAFNILQNKICTAEDIDKIIKLGITNNKNGPFGFADRIGLNVIKEILDELYKEYGDKKFVANSMLKQYIRCGKWGRKTGCGVYSYKTKLQNSSHNNSSLKKQQKKKVKQVIKVQK